MNILIFNPDPDKLRIISFALESKLGIHVIQATQVEKAFEHLLEEAAIDLLVISDTASTPLFVKYLASLNSKMPVILVGPNGLRDSRFPGINIAAHLNPETLLQDLPSLIQANYRLNQSQTGADAEYCRISVELLMRVGPLKGDVYVKLSNLKYVKMFNADATFTEDDLARVWGVKKIDYLYIKKENSAQFVQKLQSELTSIMRKAIEGDDSMLSTVSQVQETLQGLEDKTGITEQVIKLTNTHVDFALKVIGRTPQLRKVVSTVLTSKGSYVANHSVQVAHLACCIASKLNWPSNMTFQKLIFASFMHDLVLKDPDHAKIATKDDLLLHKSRVSVDEYSAIENHMFLAADVANRFSQIPSDVCQIIQQHHELPNGKGFPRGLNASTIAPLAAVFIVAHQMVDEVHARGDAFNLEVFMATHGESYTAGTFKTIAKAFSVGGQSQQAA